METLNRIWESWLEEENKANIESSPNSCFPSFPQTRHKWLTQNQEPLGRPEGALARREYAGAVPDSIPTRHPRTCSNLATPSVVRVTSSHPNVTSYLVFLTLTAGVNHSALDFLR